MRLAPLIVSLALLVPSSAAAQASTLFQNDIPNPSAATNTNGWGANVSNGKTKATLTRVATDGYEASTSLQADWKTPSASYQGYVFESKPNRHPVTGGEVVYERTALKLVAGAANAELALAVGFYRSDGSQIAIHTLEQAKAIAGKWQVLEGFDQAPAGSASYNLTVTVLKGGTTATRVRIAGAQAFRNPAEVPPVVLPGIPGVPDLDLVPEPTPPATGLGLWRVYTNGVAAATLTRDDTWSASGSGSSFRLTGLHTVLGIFSQAYVDKVPVFGGQEYTLRLAADVLESKGGSSNYAAVNFYDSSGAFVDSQKVRLVGTGPQAVRVIVPAPRLARTATVTIGADGGGESLLGRFDIRFDDVHLEPNRESDWPTRTFMVGYNDNSGIGAGLVTAEEFALNSREAGANSVRFGTGRPDEAQPVRDGAIDWRGTKLANFLDELRAQGLQATIIGGAPPTWMAANSASVASADYQRLGQVWAELLKLYSDVIVAVEWVNEPNLKNFWGANPSPAAYTAQLKAVRPLLKAAAPNVKLLAGGLNDPPTTTTTGMTTAAFLSGAYNAGLASATDGVALHPYGPFGVVASGYGDKWVRGFYPTVRSAREAMDAGGDKGEPIWVTEFGQSTEASAMFSATTEAQQAQFDRMISTLLRRTPGVESAAVHTLRVAANNPQGDFGVIDAGDLHKKLAWDALRQEWDRSW